MDNNTITYVLAAPALVLLAIIPAFLLAARQAKKMQKQEELAQFNAELDKKREQKKARRNSSRKTPVTTQVARSEGAWGIKRSEAGERSLGKPG